MVLRGREFLPKPRAEPGKEVISMQTHCAIWALTVLIQLMF
jgi:hypothetical protein